MGLCGLKTQQNKVAGVDLSTRHFTNGDIQVHVSKIASNQSISVSGKPTLALTEGQPHHCASLKIATLARRS